MTTQATVTLESLEALAASLETEDQTTRDRLQRMIRAYARILWIREPDKFTPRATIYADVDGHWDNSYPPKQVYKQKTGPRTIVVRQPDWNTRATSGGFYHDTEYYTELPGLSVDRDGDVVLATMTGVGEYGQFAAYPGACSVECEIEFGIASGADLTTADLREIEEHLRELAFPLSAEAAAKGGE